MRTYLLAQRLTRTVSYILLLVVATTLVNGVGGGPTNAAPLPARPLRRATVQGQEPAASNKMPVTKQRPIYDGEGSQKEALEIRKATEEEAQKVQPSALANITPFQPVGWSDKLIISTAPGTHSDSNPLLTTDSLFIDFAVINNGGAATTVRFTVKLFIDGVERGSWFADPPFNPTAVGFIEDFSLGSLSAGTHTLRLIADYFNDIPESSEFDNEYIKNIFVSLPVTPPNLTPYQPMDWSDKLVVSTTPGTHSDNSLLRPTDTLYIDWAVLNNGGSVTNVPYITKLFVDGVERGSWVTNPLNPNFYTYFEDHVLGTLSAGFHTLRLVADYFNNIPEGNEFDNEFTKTINVIQPATPPNLAPYQPSGWSDKIIVSTATGTHTDAATMRANETLFIDWAIINNGGSATTVRYTTKLFVDGTERSSWGTDPLSSNFYASIEDFSLGTLSAGPHTFRLVADTFNNVSESSEVDNEYTKAITILPAQQQCNALTINVSPPSAGSVSRNLQPNCTNPGEVSPEPDLLGQSAQPLPDKPASITSLPGAQRPVAVTELFRSLIAKAESAGSVPVIVGLRAAFQPEGRLSKQAVVSQQATIAHAQEGLLNRMSAFTLRNVKKFATIPFMAFEADAAGLKYLQSADDVISIGEDEAIPATLDVSTPLIGATNAWASGYTGAGQTVAILDSGVDKTHSFLSGKVVSEACFSTTGSTSISVCPGGVAQSTSSGSGVNCSLSVTGCDHGTHVAGIAAGKGVSFSGVAKDANIIAIQIFSRFDSQASCGNNPAPCAKTFGSDQVHALERVGTLSSNFNIAAVNLSIGGNVKFPLTCDTVDAPTQALKAAIDNLRSLNIATVIAAGNSGFTDGLANPACISSAISVGSTGDGTSGEQCDFGPRDAVSSFSNSASYLNLLAPGQCIQSSIPGGGFIGKQGTSMAAPHVVGAWALLRSKSPSATVDQILSALTSTGKLITDTRSGNNTMTPRIQVDAAINALGGGGSTGAYASGATVTLTATANPGSRFVKWQRDGVDFSTSSVVTVQMDAAHSLTAVFAAGPTVTISSVSFDGKKKMKINGSGFGSAPRVFMNGVDRSDFITSISDTLINIKGKKKKLGLNSGDNVIQIRSAAGGNSNTVVLTL